MNNPGGDSEELVTVARAVRTRGLKGELVAELLTDFPDRFEQVHQLIAVSPAGDHSVVELEDHWFQNDRVILKLVGYDNIETAKQFIGSEFAVGEKDRVKLPENHYYDWELEGCSVNLADGSAIGHVQSIVRTGGPEIMSIVDNEGREYLVPLAEDIVVTIDPANRTIVIDPPPGLLDL